MTASWSGGQAGYTLIELIVAAGLMVLLSALTCAVLLDAKTTIEVGGESADVQQRARVGLQAVAASLRAAGAGPHEGMAAGPLVRHFPPVWPGRSNRTDVRRGVTVVSGLASVPAATLAADAPAGTTTLAFDRHAGCPLPCGYTDRMTVAVVDGRGDFDLFVLLETDGASATVRRLAGGTDAAYARGAAVLPVELRTHYWNPSTRELRSDDGDRADFPVVNDVVQLAYAYRGDPLPPVAPRPPSGEENCLYDATGTLRAGLARLSPIDTATIPLDAALFEDGPWCGAGMEPFDADLLRIRIITVTLRLQAGNPAFRGTDARWFHSPGTAIDSSRFVKDLTIQTTITPRNLASWH